MATRSKRPQAKTSAHKTPANKTPKNQTPANKKPPKTRVAAAKLDETMIREAVIREAVTPKAPAPMPLKRPATAPVLVNAVKPEEMLPEPADDAIGDAIESAVETLEKALQAAMPVARAVNAKLVDIAQTNMNAGLELARDLASAKTPMEAMRLQMDYWQDCVGVFGSQAQELRTLSAEFLATASEPIRAHMRRS